VPLPTFCNTKGGKKGNTSKRIYASYQKGGRRKCFRATGKTNNKGKKNRNMTKLHLKKDLGERRKNRLPFLAKVEKEKKEGS